MPPLTAQQALPLMLEKVAPNIAEAIEATGILAKYIGTGGSAERVSLRSFRARLLTALASNPQQIGLDSGALPAGIGNKWDQMLMQPVSWCLGVQYSQLAQLTSDGEGVATDNAVAKTIADVARQATRSRDIFLQSGGSTGDGSLGSIDSTSGANFINLRSVTTSTIDGRGARLMLEQQTAQVMSPAYVLRGTMTIQQVFKKLGSTQQIMVDAIPPGTVAGDLIIVGGATPGAPAFINGIQVFVNTSTLGNLYGISRALPYVIANGINLSNTAQVTKPVFRIAENQIIQALGPEGLKDQFYHTHPTQVQALEELAFGDSYVPLEGGKAGAYDPMFASFTINGRKVLMNPHADMTRWDLLLKSTWNTIRWGPGMFWLKTRTGQMVFPVMDPTTGLPTVQEVMYYVLAEQFYSANPIAQGGVTGAKAPTGNN
jgi:hypothetical protein